MTDLSPRETAREASVLALGADYGDDEARAKAHYAADQVLAAVAAHDGLADELAECAPRGMSLSGLICKTHGAIGRDTDWSDHLADVVRAWMVQT